MKIVVVGGGIIGLASAYELAKEGCDVTVIESGKVGQAASHGNAAKIALGESGPVPAPGVLLQGLKWMMKPDSPLYVTPKLAPSYLRFMLSMAKHCNQQDYDSGLDLNLRMAEDANDLLDSYKAEGINFEMHQRGVMLAFETEERFKEHSAQLSIYEEHGYHAQALRGDEVFEAEPALADRIKFALKYTDDRQIEPDTLTSALAEAIRARGGEVRENTSVTDIIHAHGRVTAVVLDSAEAINTDQIVLAAGVGVRSLSKMLNAEIPIHAGKGYSLDYSPAPVQLKTSLTLEDARVAVTPLDGFIRLAGTMEFGTNSLKVNQVRIEAIRRAARENLRGWEENESGERTPWAGLRPMTSDGMPTIGRLGTFTNAWVAGGHGMLGLTLGPFTGKLIADMIAGRNPRLQPQHLAMLNPNRFLRTPAAVA